jgi:uncharacterized protein (TIGR02001 family)
VLKVGAQDYSLYNEERAQMFKQTLLAGAIAAALTPGLAMAADAAPASPHTLTGNVGFFSQYIFRGLTQTNREPALQGGLDYSHSSGLYAGTWASNISWLRDGGSYNAGGSLEWDFYGGYKGTIGKSDFTYDLGALYYWYPGDVTPTFVKADTLELYGAVGWKWISVKYSHSINNKTFGVPDSRGTYYLDVTATVPIGESGFTAIAHWGRQKFDGQTPGLAQNNDALYSYDDWKIGLSYTLPKDFTVGAFYTDTSSVNNLGYGSVGEGGVYPRNIAKGTGTIYIQKTF